jgi:hypothetical protein
MQKILEIRLIFCAIYVMYNIKRVCKRTSSSFDYLITRFLQLFCPALFKGSSSAYCSSFSLFADNSVRFGMLRRWYPIQRRPCVNKTPGRNMLDNRLSDTDDGRLSSDKSKL